MKYVEIERICGYVMAEFQACLVEHDVENREVVYENDWGNWKLVDGDGDDGVTLTSIDGQYETHLEEIEGEEELAGIIRDVVDNTFK